MEESEVLKNLKLIQYHQSLILHMLSKCHDEFYKLVILRGLTEEEVHGFYQLCSRLSMELEEQKAEGFVYFHPLYQQFKDSLNHKLQVNEVIYACISQNLYLPLMNELKGNL